MQQCSKTVRCGDAIARDWKTLFHSPGCPLFSLTTISILSILCHSIARSMSKPWVICGVHNAPWCKFKGGPILTGAQNFMRLFLMSAVPISDRLRRACGFPLGKLQRCQCKSWWVPSDCLLSVCFVCCNVSWLVSSNCRLTSFIYIDAKQMCSSRSDPGCMQTIGSFHA